MEGTVVVRGVPNQLESASRSAGAAVLAGSSMVAAQARWASGRIRRASAGERTTLEAWLDFHRATLAIKCAGLDDAQAAHPSTPPSTFTLTGLVQHMTEVERNWFRRVFAVNRRRPSTTHRPAPTIPTVASPSPRAPPLEQARATWSSEIAMARQRCANHPLTDTGRFMDQDVSLRWIYVHIIEEYARHNGHADLFRERIDGATGV